MAKSEIRVIHNLNEIPHGLRVCLYGVSQFGHTIKNTLNHLRPDIIINFLVDSFKTGFVMDLPIESPEALTRNRISGYDWVLVTSVFQEEIVAKLQSLEIENIAVIEHKMLHGLFFDPPDALKRITATLALFQSAQEQQLYNMLVEARHNMLVEARRNDESPVRDYYNTNKISSEQQYLDFLKFEKMHLLLEGGVFDGLTTQMFAKRMAPGNRIIGFDPFIEIYEASPIKQELEKDYHVEVTPYALWNENTTVKFCQDSQDASESIGASKIISDLSSAEHRSVQTIRIDDFVQERSLDRVDFIKMDIEGAEYEALQGATNTLVKFRPQLAICLYHKPQHLYEIPLFLSGLLEDYEFHIGHYSPEIWETVFYGIPKELLKN